MSANYVINSCLNSSDFFSFFIRDFSVEFLFQSHNQLYCVQRVSTQVVNERSSTNDFFFFNTQLFNDNFLYAFFDVAHGNHFPISYAHLSNGASLFDSAKFATRELLVKPQFHGMFDEFSPNLPTNSTSLVFAINAVGTKPRLHHVHAAVHMQCFTIDVSGLLRGEERHCGSNFFRFTQAIRRDL